MNTMMRAALQFPARFAERSVEAQLEFVKYVEAEVRAANLPFLVCTIWLAQLELYAKFIQLPAVLTGVQRDCNR